MVAVGGKARAKGRTRLDRHTSSGWADHFDATLGYPGEGPETPGRPPPAEATDEEADLEEETQALVADPGAVPDSSADGNSGHERMRDMRPDVTARPGAPIDGPPESFLRYLAGRLERGGAPGSSASPFRSVRLDRRPSYMIEIRNLPAEVGAQDVKTLLMRFGNLLSVKLDDELAVAEYLTFADAETAQRGLHASSLSGRALDVRLESTLASSHRERALVSSEDLLAAPSNPSRPLPRLDPGKPAKGLGPSRRLPSAEAVDREADLEKEIQALFADCSATLDSSADGPRFGHPGLPCPQLPRAAETGPALVSNSLVRTSESTEDLSAAPSRPPCPPSRLDPKEPACRPCQQCQRPCLSEAGHRARVGSTDLQAILPVPETPRIARPLETSSHVQRSGPS